MSAPPSGLRIGDAERASAADRLAGHFSHGRLDHAELDERLGRVAAATTAGDLAAVFADLPADEPVPAAAARRRTVPHRTGPPLRARRGRLGARSVILAVVLIGGAAVVAHAFTHTYSVAVWALILLVAVLWLRRARIRDGGSPPATR